MAGTDRTADWLDWGENGGTITIDEGDTVVQCMSMTPGLDFEYEGKGTLSLPSNPAVNLLASDGKPVGAPHTEKRAGVNYNLWWSRGVASLVMKKYVLDMQSQTGAAMTCAGMTSKLDLSVALYDTELINVYGGPLNSPDPVHFEAPGMVIKKYKATQNALPIDYSKAGISDGLVGASETDTITDVEIEDVVLAGAFEIDGVLSGGSITDLQGYQCLIGTLVGTGSWSGHLWKKNKFGPRQDGGPAIQFSAPCGSGWTIEDSEFLGTDPIGNPENFQGTWGKGNTPTILP